MDHVLLIYWHSALKLQYKWNNRCVYVITQKEKIIPLITLMHTDSLDKMLTSKDFTFWRLKEYRV